MLSSHGTLFPIYISVTTHTYQDHNSTIKLMQSDANSVSSDHEIRHVSGLALGRDHFAAVCCGASCVKLQVGQLVRTAREAPIHTSVPSSGLGSPLLIWWCIPWETGYEGSIDWFPALLSETHLKVLIEALTWLSPGYYWYLRNIRWKISLLPHPATTLALSLCLLLLHRK